jgi:hypothetical protein
MHPMELNLMTETNSTPVLQRTCVAWSRRREQDISLRIDYDVRVQDGCKIFTINQVVET